MPSPASSSPAPGWQNAFGDGNGDDHSAQVPPSLRRMNVGSGASSSSMYLSCLSVGGDMEVCPCVDRCYECIQGGRNRPM